MFSSGQIILVLSLFGSVAAQGFPGSPVCFICGDEGVSQVTNPDVKIPLPSYVGIPHATCGSIQQAGEVDFLIPAFGCTLLDRADFREVCGCENTLVVEQGTVSPEAPTGSDKVADSSSGSTKAPKGSATQPPSEFPSDSPSDAPSDIPSVSPTKSPKVKKTKAPFVVMSDYPSTLPSDYPSMAPSSAPSPAIRRRV